MACTSLCESLAYDTQHRVQITRQTTLDTLHFYRAGTHVEYPETGPKGVGHLFEISLESWFQPQTAFAYSLGKPDGRSQLSKPLTAMVLTDSEGRKVPCRVYHATCQGCKACPYSDVDELKTPHTSPTRADLTRQLQYQRYTDANTPFHLVFRKTFALWSAFRQVGCTAPLSEATYYSGDERKERDERLEIQAKARRGHDLKQATCEGRLLLEYNRAGKAYVRCEHYDSIYSRDHLINFDVGNGLYDLEYLQALFRGDQDEISFMEDDAAMDGIGPRALCTTVSNASSQKVVCPIEHRDKDSTLIKTELIRLDCSVIFRVYEPFPEYRVQCPKMLVTCHGAHTHPIPLPTKTPPLIRTQILDLIASLTHDLPDLTPRRLLRHPTTIAYLRNHFPLMSKPMFSDLHPSLANRDHLRLYINEVQQKCLPHGTDWAGILHLKEVEDRSLPPQDRYIRVVRECSLDLTIDDSTDGLCTSMFRMIVCMKPEASYRLATSHYLQSDIGFKRIAGFQEFEIGHLDPHSQTAIVYCRVFLNRASAEAHRLVFEAIDNIVFQDTGKRLQWRHLHAVSLSDRDHGILQWTGDQHRGQAKGLGLYLQQRARELPDQLDLHQPNRSVSSLSDYEHLHRVFRLCTNHVLRNIQETAVSKDVKNAMRSLICIKHDDWDGTISFIQSAGGKVSQNWVQDKITSKFAFEGMCLAKSFIPQDIWMAGDKTSNIIEALHSDVNREGVHCTLLGGTLKGRQYDEMKLKTLKTFESTGIHSSYQSIDPSVTAIRSLKRKGQKQYQATQRQDKAIQEHNGKLHRAAAHRDVALARLQDEIRLDATPQVIQRSQAAFDRADLAFQNAASSSLELAGTGSGREYLMLPPSYNN